MNEHPTLDDDEYDFNPPHSAPPPLISSSPARPEKRGQTPNVVGVLSHTYFLMYGVFSVQFLDL